MDKSQIEEVKEKILEQAENLPEEQANALREKIEGMADEEFEKFLKEFALPLQECIFCQIVQGKTATIKVYESKNILAILDINPVSIGHMIVMPKQHYQFLTQLPDGLLIEIFSFVKHIIPAIIRTVKSHGVTINILQGKEQNVPHFAVSIIPRFEKDKLDFTWKRLKLPKEELEKIAVSIRAEAGERAKQIAEKSTSGGIGIEGSDEETEENQEEEGNAEEETGQTEENRETKEQKTNIPEFSEEELAKFFRGRIPH